MPRSKLLPDERVLDSALDLLREGGTEGLTFASLADRCGLSAATLVQRFGSKPALAHRALLRAWDHLDAATVELAAEVPRTPAGAVQLLLGLSRQYEGPDVYRSGLLLLQEDLCDPVLRGRGVTWEIALTEALDACFASTPGRPDRIGHLLATHWQGAMTWWAFQAAAPLEEYLTESLDEILAVLVPSTAGPAR